MPINRRGLDKPLIATLIGAIPVVLLTEEAGWHHTEAQWLLAVRFGWCLVILAMVLRHCFARLEIRLGIRTKRSKAELYEDYLRVMRSRLGVSKPRKDSDANKHNGLR